MGDDEEITNFRGFYYSFYKSSYPVKLPIQEAIDECDENCEKCYQIKTLARQRGLTELVLSGKHLLEI